MGSSLMLYLICAVLSNKFTNVMFGSTFGDEKSIRRIKQLYRMVSLLAANRL